MRKKALARCHFMGMQSFEVRPWVLALIIVGLVFLIYSNTLQNPLIFDDIPNIRDNPHLRLTQLNIENLKEAAFKSPSSRRPVANISFALNYFFHGYDVIGYHLVNITVHILSGLFLWFLLETTVTIESSALPGENLTGRTEPAMLRGLPYWAALIWLVHPLHTQTVTYIVQRMNGLAALFFIMSLFFYARARLASIKWQQWILWVACGSTAVLAIGSKEIAATLPFFIFLYEWYFFQNLSGVWFRRRIPILAILILIGVALVCLFLGQSPWQNLTAGYAPRNFTIAERVLTQFRVVVFYITLLIFPNPSRLNLDHDFTLSHSLIDPPTTLVAFLLIASLVVLAILTAKRYRAISFCILWFLGNLVIESSVVGLEMVFEHRTYLPSMSFCVVCVLLAYRYIGSAGVRRACFVVIVLVLSFWTHERNAVWQAPLTLWADCAAKSPEKARPNNKAGAALEQNGRLEEAKVYYWKALVSDPGDVYAYYNLGNIARKQGRLDVAEDYYRKALHLVPEYKEARNNLGVTLVKSGKVEEGIEQFKSAIDIDTNFALAHRNLGGTLWMQGDLDAAMTHLQRALLIDPDDAETHYLLGNVLIDLKKVKEAVSHYIQALRLNPDHVDAHLRLGVLMGQAGNLAAARAQFKEALRLQPDNSAAKANLEKAMALKGGVAENR